MINQIPATIPNGVATDLTTTTVNKHSARCYRKGRWPKQHQNTKRMAEEAKRIGEDARAHAMGVGHDYQKAMESGFEVASRSIGEVNRGLQAIAAEMTDFSKKRFEDIFQSWEQLLPCTIFRRRGRRPGAVCTKGI